ncbi:sigma-E factor regulatory protein RseB domain-containing protein [Bailinhaonella thermotolerans]|uniref:MucB/RseB N-terminal domain-containing protein n=1 Tax=Bailinhaonella thermotolerans TaxID=1070861 RepID=A0A3A4B541_9ACTN|nr:sigma-E factor regulatory protein RseB domain-containing protein [Bailinhaonella thermotolerans]RJL33457.1 hypothetical protein D5H75_11795 [Bailinhaonella thermotolerans]
MRTPAPAAAHRLSLTAGVVSAVVLLCLLVASPAHARPPVDPHENEDTALPLLRDAAAAARARSYSGVQFVTTWGRGQSSTSLVDISHTPGQGSVLTLPATGNRPGGRVHTGSGGGTVNGVMAAPSEAMLGILAVNYRVAQAGSGTVCGREARIVEVLRTNGTPAARFWIDSDSHLVLRREIIDARGRITHASAFIDLRVNPPGPASATAAGASAPGPLRPEALESVRARGWRFPGTLPGRLELFLAKDGSSAEGRYLHLGYSDGLSVVSVFVQPGSLDTAKLTGWREQRQGGHSVWVRDTPQQETVWESGGHVYTLLADAPADTVEGAIGALPHVDRPSLWDRLRRGLEKVVSWVNPFG